MSSTYDDFEAARKSADRFVWQVIGVLLVVTVVAFAALFEWEDRQSRDETCAQRAERVAKESGIPLLYDPRTGRPMGCGKRQR